MLKVEKLKVSIEDKDILQGLDLSINENEVHALMGPNGSGKSTLAQTLMGHPNYEVSSGNVMFLGKELLGMDTTVRALSGLFLSFQYPSEIEGLTISNYLRFIYNKLHSKKLTPILFRKILQEKMELLEINPEFMNRYLNSGFSGGEKKRMEMLQMLITEPKLVILDEVDSGLDIDALKIVSKAVNYLREQNKMSVLLITHYTRILKYISPDFVHIMKDGVIARSGSKELADELEEKGYAPFGE